MTEYVCLISGDDVEFILTRPAAEGAALLHQLIALQDPTADTNALTSTSTSTSNPSSCASLASPQLPRVVIRIPLPEIPSRVLDVICRFLAFKARSGRPMTDFPPFRAFDPANADHRNLVVDILLAANYLDC